MKLQSQADAYLRHRSARIEPGSQAEARTLGLWFYWLPLSAAN